MSEHTPIPWRWDGEDLWHFGVGYSDELDPHRYTGISIDRRLRSSPILEKNMEFIVNAVNSHDALVAALKQARRALNLGLNLAYEKNSSANEGFVVCGCCRERWKIIRHEDNTAGANVQHNPESICGIMQAKMYAIDAALKAAGEL